MTTKSLNIEYGSRRWFWSLAVGLTCLLIIYLYFVNRMVFDLWSRERTLVQVRTINTRVTELEQQSAQLSAKLTIELANQLGLHDLPKEDISYAYRDQGSLVSWQVGQ